MPIVLSKLMVKTRFYLFFQILLFLLNVLEYKPINIMNHLDPFAKINWADVVDSDVDDDYPKLDAELDGPQKNALQDGIKWLNVGRTNLLATTLAQISSNSITLLKPV